jgi:hypothetical protein
LLGGGHLYTLDIDSRVATEILYSGADGPTGSYINLISFNGRIIADDGGRFF